MFGIERSGVSGSRTPQCRTARTTKCKCKYELQLTVCSALHQQTKNNENFG